MTEVEKNSEVSEEIAPLLTITESAANHLTSLLQSRNMPNHALRVFVGGGGCSGLQYGMTFVETPGDFDQVIEMHGIRLVVDPTSAMYLEGAKIDFVDNLMGGGFRIENPQAVSTCGCGHSFRTAHDSSASAGGGGSCH